MIILRLIGLLYIVIGIWCTILPEQTARSIGYQLSSGSGMSEYITVYGGLEVGLGLAMIITSFVRRLRLGGLSFAYILSMCLLLFRIPTIVLYEIQHITYYLLCVELLFAVLLGWILWREAKHIS
jgi:hypothetical protein